MKKKATAALLLSVLVLFASLLPRAASPAAGASASKTPTALPGTPPPLTRTLKLSSPAMRGEDVRLLQERLLSLGYSEIGAADGIFGKKIDSAVRKFQAAAGLTADGLVGPRTWQALFAAAPPVGTPPPTAAAATSAAPSSQQASPAPAPSPTPRASPTPDPNFKPLQLGDFTSRVDALHQALIELGYSICNPGGDFSWQTETAVKTFQRANGLIQDGIAGQETWALLNSGDAKPAPTAEAEVMQFEAPFRLEKSGNGITYEDKRLLVIFNAQQRLARIDPKGPSILKYISIPNLGTAKDPWGKPYPLQFVSSGVARVDNVIWLGGGTHFGAAQAEPAVMAIDPGGKLLGGPFKFGGTADAGFMTMLPAGEEALAFYMTYSGGPSLWKMDVKAGLQRKFGLDPRLIDASASAYDGRRIWLSLPDQGKAIVPMNPANGILGTPLGACGNKLAYDGTWLWVLQEKEVAAYDLATGQLQARAQAPKGYTLSHIAARENQTAVLAVNNAKGYLFILNH